jgi:hypothetical protein
MKETIESAFYAFYICVMCPTCDGYAARRRGQGKRKRL